MVEVSVIQTIDEAIKSLKDIFKKQKEIAEKQEKLDQKLAKKEISEENYQKETQNNNENWKKLVDAQINAEKFIEENPLLSSEETSELRDLQLKSLIVSNKITPQDVQNAKYRSGKTTKILEDLKNREEKLVSEFEKVIVDFEKQRDENIGFLELEIDTISKKVLDHKFAEYILPDIEFTRKGEYLGEFKLVERGNTRYVWEGNYWTKITDEGNGKYSLIIISGFNHSVIKNIEFYKYENPIFLLIFCFW